MKNKIKLPTVTLFAASSVEIDHAQDSLKISSYEIEFASIKFLTSKKPKINFPEIEYIEIPEIDINGYNKIMINDRIKLLGVLEKNMLEKYYNEAFFYIQPSIYEGFGYPPLEAMSCGCPVLSSNKGSLAEICRNAALYFDAYDYKDISLKMKDFIYNKDLYEKYIDR